MADEDISALKCAHKPSQGFGTKQRPAGCHSAHERQSRANNLGWRLVTFIVVSNDICWRLTEDESYLSVALELRNVL